jgi:hypothetical protein
VITIGVGTSVPKTNSGMLVDVGSGVIASTVGVGAGAVGVGVDGVVVGVRVDGVGVAKLKVIGVFVGRGVTVNPTKKGKVLVGREGGGGGFVPLKAGESVWVGKTTLNCGGVFVGNSSSSGLGSAVNSITGGSNADSVGVLSS